MQPRVNKWLDLLDRAGWTALQAAAAAAVVQISDVADLGWSGFFVIVGTAAAGAALKTIVGQRVGDEETGSLIGKPVIEPPPK